MRTRENGRNGERESIMRTRESRRNGERENIVYLRKSKDAISVWLDAVSRGQTPSGIRVNVVRVAEGEVKPVYVKGDQHSGSNGHGVSSSYAGKEPRMVIGSERYKLTHTSDSYALFCLMSPSIVLSSVCYAKGVRNDFAQTVFVCASDEQIAAAIAEMKAQRRKNREDTKVKD